MWALASPLGESVRTSTLQLIEKESKPAMMIYVGNLDYAVSSSELRVLFEPFGSVTLADVQLKSRTGQSRGFGLVDMPSAAEAEAAIAALNGSDFRGRKLTVNESRPRRSVRDQYASGGWFGGGGGR
jgi:cold-inducible RNA-binding protein